MLAVRVSRVPSAEERVARMHRDRDRLTERLRKAVEWQANAYNKHHQPMTFKKGDLVLLSTKNLTWSEPSKKLAHKRIGPFRIAEALGTQEKRI